MTIIVKIGGKSQGSEEKIEAFAEQLVSQFGRKEPLVLVVSAIGDSTDQLQAAIRKRRPDISDLTVEPDRYFTRFGGDESRYGSIRREFEMFYGTLIRNNLSQLMAPVLVTPERFASFLMASALKKIRGRNVEWLDFYSPIFPLVPTAGESNYLSASVDLIRSREKSRSAGMLLRDNDVVIPGFGGISTGNGNPIKTFGRGGSDEAAFGCGYALGADEIWICSDVDGIKTAVIEGRETETLPYLDIEETKAGAFLGAKLPSEQALRPLEKMYESGLRPKVYIAYAQNLSGNKTEIIPFDESKTNLFPPRLVAGRDITFHYVMNGNPQNLHAVEGYFIEAGIDYRVFGKSGTRAEIGIFGKGSDVADEIVRRYENGELSVQRHDRAIVGVVGSDMRHMSRVGGRISSTLGQHNIGYCSENDYNDSSTVYNISKADLKRAILSLYENLSFIRSG